MENIDTMIELYKTQLEQWNKRRVEEWGVTLAFWTSITVVTGLLAGKVQITKTHLLGYIVVWLFYIILWAWKISQANRYDKTWARLYLSKIQSTLKIKERKEFVYTEPKWWNPFQDWSFWAKIIFTGGILGTSWLILFVAPIQNKICP